MATRLEGASKSWRTKRRGYRGSVYGEDETKLRSFEGRLMKKGHGMFAGWKEHFFRTNNHYLNYYDSAQSWCQLQARGARPLAALNMLLATNVERKGTEITISFNGGHELELKALTGQEANNWVYELNKRMTWFENPSNKVGYFGDEAAPTDTVASVGKHLLHDAMNGTETEPKPVKSAEQSHRRRGRRTQERARARKQAAASARGESALTRKSSAVKEAAVDAAVVERAATPRLSATADATADDAPETPSKEGMLERYTLFPWPTWHDHWAVLGPGPELVLYSDRNKRKVEERVNLTGAAVEPQDKGGNFEIVGPSKESILLRPDKKNRKEASKWIFALQLAAVEAQGEGPAAPFSLVPTPRPASSGASRRMKQKLEGAAIKMQAKFRAHKTRQSMSSSLTDHGLAASRQIEARIDRKRDSLRGLVSGGGGEGSSSKTPRTRQANAEMLEGLWRTCHNARGFALRKPYCTWTHAKQEEGRRQVHERQRELILHAIQTACASVVARVSDVAPEKLRTKRGGLAELVVGKQAMGIVKSVSSKRQIDEKSGRTVKVANLSSNRARHKLAGGVYLLCVESGVKKSIQRLLDDFKDDATATYRGCVAVIFMGTPPEKDLERIAQCAPLVRRLLGPPTVIQADFMVQERAVVSLGMPDAFARLYGPYFGGGRQDGVYMAFIDALVDKLVAVCACLNEFPHVRYQNSNRLTSLVAMFLHEKLESLVRDDAKYWYHFPRSTLVVVDRLVDPKAPLLHDTHLQGAIHEFLGAGVLPRPLTIEGARVEIKGEPVLRMADASYAWITHRYMTLDEVASKALEEEDAEQYAAAMQHESRKRGLSIAFGRRSSASGSGLRGSLGHGGAGVATMKSGVVDADGAVLSTSTGLLRVCRACAKSGGVAALRQLSGAEQTLASGVKWPSPGDIAAAAGAAAEQGMCGKKGSMMGMGMASMRDMGMNMGMSNMRPRSFGRRGASSRLRDAGVPSKLRMSDSVDILTESAMSVSTLPALRRVLALWLLLYRNASERDKAEVLEMVANSASCLQDDNSGAGGVLIAVAEKLAASVGDWLPSPDGGQSAMAKEQARCLAHARALQLEVDPTEPSIPELYVPVLRTLVEAQMDGNLAQDAMEDPGDGHTYPYFPVPPPPMPPMPGQTPPRIIVAVLGGATFSEIRALSELRAETGRDILLVTTHVFDSGDEFMDNVAAAAKIGK